MKTVEEVESEEVERIAWKLRLVQSEYGKLPQNLVIIGQNLDLLGGAICGIPYVYCPTGGEKLGNWENWKACQCFEDFDPPENSRRDSLLAELNQVTQFLAELPKSAVIEEASLLARKERLEKELKEVE
jgi:hypothetical protein